MTLSTLTVGTILNYNDASNVNLQYVVLDSYRDAFGQWVNVMDLESLNIEPMRADRKINNTLTLS